MSAFRKLFFTPEGDLRCVNGAKELSFCFSDTYKGFYPTCRFSAGCAGENGYYLAGTDDGGAAHLFTSVSGETWSELNLVPKDRPRLPYECGTIRCVIETAQAVFAVSENGYVITLPGCPKCVKAVQYPERFLGAVLRGGELLVQCASGREQPILLEALQQVRTSWSYALPFLKDGALLIDLREESEEDRELPYAQHESLQCALLRIRRLKATEPLFFFCYTGQQADTAAEFARRLGHGNAFSLGGPEHLLSRNNGLWPEKA